jgi:hypothetical protein
VTRQRIGLAVLLSPWAAPALVILMAVVSARGWPFHYELGLVVFASVVTSYAVVMLLGLPLFKWLKTHQRLDWPTLVACGAAAGVICFFAFEVLLAVLRGSTFAAVAHTALLASVWGVTLGAGVSAMFSLIVGLPAKQARISG